MSSSETGSIFAGLTLDLRRTSGNHRFSKLFNQLGRQAALHTPGKAIQSLAQSLSPVFGSPWKKSLEGSILFVEQARSRLNIMTGTNSMTENGPQQQPLVRKRVVTSVGQQLYSDQGDSQVLGPACRQQGVTTWQCDGHPFVLWSASGGIPKRGHAPVPDAMEATNATRCPILPLSDSEL